MAQFSVTGKDEEIQFIQNSYNKLGIKRSPRVVDLAIKDINNIINNNDIDDNDDYNLLNYEINKFESNFKLEINLFEYTLRKIKTKITNNYEEAQIHFDEFIRQLYMLQKKLYKYRKSLKNFDSLDIEWNQITILIKYLKNNEKGKIFEWYQKYKKSNVIYEYYKSKYGFNDEKINKIQKLVNELKKENINSKQTL